MKNEPSTADPLVSKTNELLEAQGYKLIDDAWTEFGRLTYLHDDDADKDYIGGLTRVLRSAGWQKDGRKLRTFHHPTSQHEIEVEPGGSETTGHFLRHMRPQSTRKRKEQ